MTDRLVGLCVRTEDPFAELARTVEQPGEFEAYERESLFLLVLDREAGKLAAAGRVIEGGGRTLDEAPDRVGTPLSEVVERYGMYDGKIWDLATLAIRPGFGPSAGALLFRTFLNAGRRASVRHVVAMPDQRTYRALALLGVPMDPIGGSTSAVYFSFPGTTSSIAAQAVRLRRFNSPFAGEIPFRGLRRLLTRRAASRTAHQVATGEGLDDRVELPGLERRRLRPYR